MAIVSDRFEEGNSFRMTSRLSSASRWAGLLLLAGAGALLGSSDPPTANSEAGSTDSGHAVVVELFTSQGCSSCPPADRVLSEIGAQQSPPVIPLSFHVDYWNHDGWTDPFSRRDWTERQSAYARVLGLQQVYTPEAVVDGRSEMVGSDGNRLRTAIAAASKRTAASVSIRLELAKSKVAVTADVDRPEILRGRKLDVMVAVFETNLVTSVGRGENSGRTLRNDYVVRTLRRAGTLAAGAANPATQTATLSLEDSWKKAELGVVAFVQDPASLEILGATTRRLSPEQHASR
jgi:hypothetical protein